MSESEFEYADTNAARLLANGLARASAERGLSVRKIGKLLGYKQAVVLSHMANGRVPIPIDRAQDIAEVLQLNTAKFLTAVVHQRHPGVEWGLLANALRPKQARSLADDLEAILGAPLDSLSSEQRMVLREVAADEHPRRRWLSVHEMPIIEAIRTQNPSLNALALDNVDIDEILESLTKDERRE